MTRLERLEKECREAKPLPVVGKLDWNDPTNSFYLSDIDLVYVRNKNGEFAVRYNEDLVESNIDPYWGGLDKSHVKEMLEAGKSRTQHLLKDMMSKIRDAIIFATLKHNGQVRKGTDIPYIVHPHGGYANTHGK